MSLGAILIICSSVFILMVVLILPTFIGMGLYRKLSDPLDIRIREELDANDNSSYFIEVRYIYFWFVETWVDYHNGNCGPFYFNIEDARNGVDLVTSEFNAKNRKIVKYYTKDKS